jgi:hypothetical protein
MPYYHSLDLGGAEHLLVNLAEEMEGVNITVVSLESEAVLAEPLRDAGARVLNLDEAFRFDPQMFRALREILSAEDFDIVHNHLPYAQTIGRLTARSTGHGVIVSTTERITRQLDTVTVAVTRCRTGIHRIRS